MNAQKTPKTTQARGTKVAASLLLGVALIGPAQALTLKSQQLNGAQLSDLSSSNLLALDLSFFGQAPVELEFELDAEDVGQSVAFNSVLKAVGGANFLPGLQVQLSGGAGFNRIGSVYTPASLDLQATTSASANSPITVATVSSAGQNEIYLGDPFAEGKQDWRIQFAGLQQGDRFVMNITQVSAVPEPSKAALLAIGCLALMLSRRFRRAD